jgi:hypothetical protein
VQSVDDPTRFVVAVRGTNPISLTDWMRGDLDVAQPAPWPFGDGTGRVSGSTASGLNTLLELTEPGPSRMGAIVEEVLYRLSQFVPDAVARLVRRFPVGRVHALDPLVDPLQELFGRWEQQLATGAAGAAQDEVVTGLRDVSRKQRAVMVWPSRAPDGTGATLVDFLMRMAVNGPLEVIVTGHSKGGALAPALALWLAETRARWDPTGNARIGCYAYAGPTPGNGAFGRRVGEKLNGPMRRVINQDDIVTHAWDDQGLASIPALCAGTLAWVQPITDAVMAKITTDLDYEPVSIPEEKFEGLALSPKHERCDPAVEIPYQHMAAYLEYLHLPEKGIDTLRLFQG